jgi:hypothetical protein
MKDGEFVNYLRNFQCLKEPAMELEAALKIEISASYESEFGLYGSSEINLIILSADIRNEM